jgi:hypothetical protein
MSFDFSAKHVTLGFRSYFPGTDVGFETGTYTVLVFMHIIIWTWLFMAIFWHFLL